MDVLRLRDQQKQLQTFLGELQDMKADLLRVAGLPYRPNLNDGVIINAVPLYGLFRHREWAGSCEECWNNLKNGDFDWAHMAMSIRPMEVREKCKTDLSLAIAHSLEASVKGQPASGKKRARKKKT